MSLTGIPRDRNTFVLSEPNPLIRRGNGIYRRQGDNFYGYFPGTQFDDFRVITGRFANGGQEIFVDQIPEQGFCNAN